MPRGRRVAIVSAAGVAAALHAASPQPASGRTWHIFNDGTGDAHTVQAGIDSAAVGDTVLVEMFVADCGWGGHGGYAFLDGIGTAYQPPDDPIVPVPAAVLLGTLGISLAGWLSHRRGELLA